jgi:hypothetical protein
MDRIDSLRRLPFELAYLALLTAYRIKPLSRWESALDPRGIDVLAGLGLEIAEIDRRTLFGRRLRNVVFSMSPPRVREYRRRFDGLRLRGSGVETRLEGWFFGYPSCCVDRFVRTPYAENGLLEKDRRILFHWACPDCAGTESLLRECRRVHAECVRIMGGEPGRAAPACVREARSSGAAMPWAASIAALALLCSLQGAAANDPHVLPAPDDSDGDGLSYAEERLLGMCPTLSDADGNAIRDGIDASVMLHAMIAALPASPVPDGPYALEVPMDGLEQCAVCGALVNMGYYRIIHPLRRLEAELPVIALHYLQHGSVGYEGDVHGAGRADIEGLKAILFPSDPAHHMCRPVEEDIDGDMLGSDEEALLGTDPADPDTDGDSLGDAPQTAERLLAALSALPREERPDGPFVVDHEERGLEACATCGRLMNMGYLEIANPLEGFSLQLPYVALHYLAHGSFGASGDVHVNADVLPSVIDVALRSAGGAHLIPIEGDADGDGLTDEEEQALGLNENDPDCDMDGTPDGPDLALFLHEHIGTLPVCPEGELEPADRIFVKHNPTFGTYHCLICGEAINMGFMRIVNPAKGSETNLSYYNHHFMACGGLSTDRPGLYPRADVASLVGVLDLAVAAADVPSPARAILSSAPNPFNGATKISLHMPAAADIGVAVFDAAGRRVRELHAGRVPAGASEFLWNGKDASGRELAPGVYFCAIRIGSISLSKKMVMVR